MSKVISGVFDRILSRSNCGMDVFRCVEFIIGGPRTLRIMSELVILRRRRKLSVFKERRSVRRSSFTLRHFVQGLFKWTNVFVHFKVSTVPRNTLSSGDSSAPFTRGRTLRYGRVSNFLWNRPTSTRFFHRDGLIQRRFAFHVFPVNSTTPRLVHSFFVFFRCDHSS